MNNIYFNYLADEGKWKFPRKYYNFGRLDFLKEHIWGYWRTDNKEKILDLGCGCGDMMTPFYKDFEVYGLDIDKKSIEYCKEKYDGKGIFQVGNAYKLPYNDNYFDMIVMTDVIEHLTNPSKAVFEIRRILKQDGLLLITTPNYGSIRWHLVENTWHRFFGGNCKPYKKEIHYTKFNEKRLFKLLKNSFSNIKVRTIVHNLCLVAVVNVGKDDFTIY